ncbi:TPA: restriction endonuclease subunit S [Legionella pneumophila]
MKPPKFKLSQICDITMGQAPKGSSYNDVNEGYPLIAGAGDFGVKTPKPKKHTVKPTRLSANGDLILCIRATIGDLNWSDNQYCLGRGVAGLRPISNKLDKNYLWHFLQFYKEELQKKGTGSTFKQISRSHIEEIEVPLPPLQEQKRIAAILDKADAVRRKRQQAIELSEQLLRSVFLDMFGDPVTNPKGWQVKKLQEVCLKITDGVHQKPTYSEEGVPFISVKDITTGKLSFDNCKFISKEDHVKYFKRCNPEWLDVLYTKVGATYGRPALVTTHEEFSLYVSVALIKPNKNLINPYFLKETLASPAIKHQADRSIKGIGVPDLHLIEIKSFLIAVPPMKVQDEFVKKAKKIINKVNLQNNSLIQLNNLFSSLTQKAFSGELSKHLNTALV